MKKRLENKILLGLALLTFGFTRPNFNIGDKMPDFYDREYTQKIFQTKFTAHSFGLWKKGEKKGSWTRYDALDMPVGYPSVNFIPDGKADYMEVTVECDGKQKMFGFTDFKTVYLDKDLKGYIKEIKQATGNFRHDAPDCPNN